MKVYYSNFMIYPPISEEDQHGAWARAGKHEALRGVAGRRLSGIPGTVLNQLVNFSFCGFERLCSLI